MIASTGSPPATASSGSQRNLPRRAAERISRPVSAASNCAPSPSYRVSARSSSTDTPAIEAPETAGASPARTTSTSGSSGTLAELAPGREGCGHLGVLLARADSGCRDRPHAHGRGEDPIVIGPLGDHRVERRSGADVRGELLEARL